MIDFVCLSVESFLIQKWERLRDEYYKGFANGILSRIPHASDLAFLKPSRTSKTQCFAAEDEDEEEAEFVITLEQIEAADEEREEENAMLEETLMGQHDAEEEARPSNVEHSASSDDSVKNEVVNVVKREKSYEKGTKRAETLAPDASNADNRTEDQIFGDFVAATLAKMPIDEKKKIKREIMNILL